MGSQARHPDTLTYKNITQNFKDGIFDSPIRDYDELRLDANVTHFYNEYGLNKVLKLNALRRGALLAQLRGNLRPPTDERTDFEKDHLLAEHDDDDSGIPRSIRTLSRAESDALKREEEGSLRSLTKMQIVILATCAIGAVAQGWAQQSIVGANISWPVELGIANRIDNSIVYNRFDSNAGPDNPDKGLELFSLVNAITYFAAGILGSSIHDPITYVLGRRFALLFAGICSFAGPIGASYCSSWLGLFFCRLVQGLGMGAKASVVPVLEAEVFGKETRTRLLVSWQTFVALGILLGSSTNLIFHDNWRHQIGIAFVPAIPLIALCYVIPESPRWLMKKGKYREAYLVTLQLRETPLQAARDLYLIYEQLLLERHLFSTKRKQPRRGDAEQARPSRHDSDSSDTNLKSGLVNYFIRVPRLFSRSIPRNQRAVVAASVVMIAQQFSGINIFAFLSTTIFEASGINDLKNLWFSWGFGLANFIFSASAYFYIDRLGRRTLLLTSLTLMLPFLLLAGHYMDESRPPSSGAIMPLVIIYAAFYSPGAGVIPFMYCSEIFPQDFREIGMSLSVAVNFTFAGGLAMAVPQFVGTSQSRYPKLLGAFAGLDGLAAILVWAFMRAPERAISLGDMNFLFGAPTKDYIAYQIKVCIPWFFKGIPSLWHSRAKDSFDEWQRRRKRTSKVEAERPGEGVDEVYPK